jgi:hypothetical protein
MNATAIPAATPVGGGIGRKAGTHGRSSIAPAAAIPKRSASCPSATSRCATTIPAPSDMTPT